MVCNRKILYLLLSVCVGFTASCRTNISQNSNTNSRSENSAAVQPSEKDLIVISKKNGEVYVQTEDDKKLKVGVISDEAGLREYFRNLLEKRKNKTFFIKFEVGMSLHQSRIVADILESLGGVSTGAEASEKEINVAN